MLENGFDVCENSRDDTVAQGPRIPTAQAPEIHAACATVYMQS